MSERLELERVVTNAGVWTISTVLDAQLVREKGPQRIWEYANPSHFRAVGASVHIVLPDFERTFVTALPPDYPTEIFDDLQTKIVTDGLTVKGGRFINDKVDKFGAEFTVVVPSPPHAVAVALRIDLVKINETPVQGWICSLLMDVDGNSSVERGERLLGDSIRPLLNTAEFRLTCSLPGIRPGTIQPPCNLQIAIRSAREAALQADAIESFLQVPEIRRTVVLTGGQ